jgi:hypothetical protein
VDTLAEFEKMLPSLSRGEKAQLLKWVVQELGHDFPGVDSRPRVCEGWSEVVELVPVRQRRSPILG